MINSASSHSLTPMVIALSWNGHAITFHIFLFLESNITEEERKITMTYLCTCRQSKSDSQTQNKDRDSIFYHVLNYHENSMLLRKNGF